MTRLALGLAQGRGMQQLLQVQGLEVVRRAQLLVQLLQLLRQLQLQLRQTLPPQAPYGQSVQVRPPMLLLCSLTVCFLGDAATK